MKAPLQVSLAQCDAVLGDLDKNLEAHLSGIETAVEQGAGLVVFPELSLTGYQLRDLAREVACPLDAGRLAPLKEASRRIDVVFGLMEEGSGHHVYNTAVYLSGGEILHAHRKVYLPTYQMFEEQRYWAAGSVVAAFDTAFGRVGLLTCEDVWHTSTSYLLFVDRADMIITPSASPARGVLLEGPSDGSDELMPGSNDAWNDLLRHQSSAFNLFSIYVNRTGVEDGTSFCGNSQVIDPFGHVLTRLGMGAEQETIELDPDVLRRRRQALPMLSDERTDVTMGNLERIHRDRFED
jgi:predicted amidohydrolase